MSCSMYLCAAMPAYQQSRSVPEALKTDQRTLHLRVRYPPHLKGVRKARSRWFCCLRWLCLLKCKGIRLEYVLVSSDRLKASAITSESGRDNGRVIEPVS